MECKPTYDELMKVLEPFADMASEGTDDYSDDEKVIIKIGRHTDYTIRLGDFRRVTDVIARATAKQSA